MYITIIMVFESLGRKLIESPMELTKNTFGVCVCVSVHACVRMYVCGREPLDR